MEKKYIDQKEWINRLEEELKSTKDEQRKTYLNIWINAIKCQPTVDEKEIIRKAMERIKARIDEKMESVDYWTKPYDKYEYYDK